MSLLTTITTFSGATVVEESSFNSQPIFQFDLDLKQRAKISVSVVIFQGNHSKPNSKSVIPVGISGSGSIAKHYYRNTDFYSHFPSVPRVLTNIDDIDIDVLDTQDYVIVTGSGIAIGIIPYWS